MVANKRWMANNIVRTESQAHKLANQNRAQNEMYDMLQEQHNMEDMEMLDRGVQDASYEMKSGAVDFSRKRGGAKKNKKGFFSKMNDALASKAQVSTKSKHY